MTQFQGALAALPQPTGIAGGLRTGGRTLQRFLAAAIERRCEKRTVAALAALSDRTLKDIGVSRGQIGYVAGTAARRGSATVRGIMTTGYIVALVLTLSISASATAAEIPDAIAAAGEMHVVTVHAQGAQVYECKAGPVGTLAWSFREPVATLLLDGKTVGRHYAGPHWEWQDGSTVAAKLSARAPGATARDIPLLKLEVTARRGSGMLDGVTTIQRLNTQGGLAEGPCPTAGAFLSVPYAADYAFYRRARAAKRD